MSKQKNTQKGGILFKISPMATTGLAALTLRRLRRLDHKLTTGIHARLPTADQTNFYEF